MLTKKRTGGEFRETAKTNNTNISEVDLESEQIKENLSKNKNQSKNKMIFYVLITLFLFGMIYGILLSKYNFNSFFDNSFFNGEMKNTNSQSKTAIQISLNSLFVNLIYFAIAYFFGYCAIGQGISLFLPFFKGLGIGLTIANLYLQYTFKGVVYSAVMIIPQTSVALFGMIIACCESVKFSNVFFKSLCSNSGAKMNKGAIKLYNLKFSILLGVIAISFVLDFVLRFIFQKVIILS